MRTRRVFLWTLLLGQLTASALLAIAFGLDGQPVESAIYAAVETLRGWFVSGGESDHLVRFGRFLQFWWFPVVAATIAFNLLASAVYAALEHGVPIWQRILWVVFIWVAWVVTIPVFCIVALRRLGRPGTGQMASPGAVA